MLAAHHHAGQLPAGTASYKVGLDSARVVERVATLRELADELPTLSPEVKQMLLTFYEYTEAYRYCALVYKSMQADANA